MLGGHDLEMVGNVGRQDDQVLMRQSHQMGSDRCVNRQIG